MKQINETYIKIIFKIGWINALTTPDRNYHQIYLRIIGAYAKRGGANESHVIFIYELCVFQKVNTFCQQTSTSPANDNHVQ